jgi:hypothetical protein
MYQQSYALVTWLCRHRKTQLRAYLHDMAHVTGEEAQSSGNQLAMFESHFGDVKSIERTWLNHERTTLATRRRADASAAR